ncbi:MAG TPA: M48 family metallopeptidase [Candidatus Binataceae bacterium]|nr:M48 family metallopeptidase [Candidatus Binataceae bacterium]
MAASDFRALESKNRRRTAVLVAGFFVLYTLLGLGLDSIAREISIVRGIVYPFPIFTTLAIIIVTIQVFASFYSGASLVLASVHARPLTPDTPKHEMALNVITEMAIAARMPVPKAYVMDDPSPNAFATGRDPAHSVICVTQGLADEMDREELQGVIGHEMSHIANYDIRTMMMIAGLAGGIAMLSGIVYDGIFSSGSGGVDSDVNLVLADWKAANAMEALQLIAAIPAFIFASVAQSFAQMIAMAVSHEREYLADASSVEFTRNPRGLLRALQKIAETEFPLKARTAGTAHLFLVNPRERFRNSADSESYGLRGPKPGPEAFEDQEAFDAHPPLDLRIARLRAMLGETCATTGNA